MKYMGSKMEYSEERVRDLQRAFDEYMSAHRYSCRMTDVYNDIVAMPSKRFWVSPMRAAQVISSLIRGDNRKLRRMRATKREMYIEILSRVKRLQEENSPDMSLYALCRVVVKQPAPKFYLMPGSAKLMLCKARRKWRQERLKKLRHL